jgi:hypothetical protein
VHCWFCEHFEQSKAGGLLASELVSETDACGAWLHPNKRIRMMPATSPAAMALFMPQVALSSIKSFFSHILKPRKK